MAALGFAWRQQIVAAVESGRRRLTVNELLGLALALETSIGALLDPSMDDSLVRLPSGSVLLAHTVLRSVRHFNDGMVSWEGDKPRFASREPDTWPDTVTGRQLREETRRLEEEMRKTADPGPEITAENVRGLLEFEDADHDERARRLYPEPPGGWPEPGPPPEVPQPVVAAIVTSDLGILVGRRNDGKPPWTFIAGELEPGEQPEDAAIREVKEETGLRVTAGQVIGRRYHPKTDRRMIYIAATPTHGTDVFVGDSDELAEVRWVSLPEAEELLSGMYQPVWEYLMATIGPGSGS